MSQILRGADLGWPRDLFHTLREIDQAVRNSGANPLRTDDPHVRAYLEQLGRRTRPVIQAMEAAEVATPGSQRNETSNGDGTTRVRVSVPLTSKEAFATLGAGLASHARNARDIRSNERLMTDTGHPPPGWDALRWRALAVAVGRPETDAETPDGRERIVVAAMAAVSARRLTTVPPPPPSPPTPVQLAVATRRVLPRLAERFRSGRTGLTRRNFQLLLGLDFGDSHQAILELEIAGCLASQATEPPPVEGRGVSLDGAAEHLELRMARIAQTALGHGLIDDGWLLILPSILALAEAQSALPPQPASEGDATGGTKPEWDDVNRVLRFGNWEKRYKASAKNQTRVLNAFQKAGWPDRIDNPLGHESPNTTVRDLKDSLRREGEPPIAFEMDGTGGGIRWRVAGTPAELS